MTTPPDHPRVELGRLLERRPELEGCSISLEGLYRALVRVFESGGKLLVGGNGGSCADAMHIAGELCKSFEAKRPVPMEMAQSLEGLPFGEELARHLEVGLPIIPLGLGASLRTAVDNDNALRHIAMAQECYALIEPGDLLLAISTSGNATSCLMAMSVARARRAATACLTGPDGGRLAAVADIAVRAPGGSTRVIQESHLALYHTLCAMVEAHFFPPGAAS
jgi:D-sedoheptulose 7-phosphate isomerase